MKVSSLKKRTHPTKRVAVFAPLCVDEYHKFSGDSMKTMMGFFQPKLGTAKFLATQGMLRGKRGKRILFGRTVDAVTGQPFPPLPKKFLPAQVLRRQAQ